MELIVDKKPHLSLDGLEGIQSVRTTFRFSERAEKALDRLKNVTKTTTKEILDKFARVVLQNKDLTEILAENVAKGSASQDLGARKTWVISKVTLTLINSTAQLKGLSRDALAEGLVLFADDLIKEVKRNRPEQHKQAHAIIDDFWHQAEQIENQLTNLLGEDDPIYMRFQFVGTILMDLSMAIDAEIQEGTPIDPDDMSQQG